MAASSKKSRQTHKMEAGINQFQNNRNKQQMRSQPAAKTRNKGGEISVASKQKK